MNIAKKLPLDEFCGREQDKLKEIFAEFFEVTEMFIFELPFDSVTAEINHAGKKVGRYNFKTEELTIFKS